MLGVGPGHRLAAQQVAAAGVAERQRVDPHAVAGPEPALEVDGPDVVGRVAGEERPARRAPPPEPALHRQSLAIEQRPDRARRRPGPRRLLRARGRPAPSPAPRSDAPGAPRGRPRPAPPPPLRMAERRPRPVEEPGHPVQSPALQPLYPFCRLIPNCRHTAAIGSSSPATAKHEAHPLVHRTGLLPGHRQGPPCRHDDLSPMSSVRSVTDVAGLDRAYPPLEGQGYRRWKFPSLSRCLTGVDRSSLEQVVESDREQNGIGPRIVDPFVKPNSHRTIYFYAGFFHLR